MSVPEAILFATGNPHKLAEVQAICEKVNIRVEGLAGLGLSLSEPVEDGRTFLDNALIKARDYARQTNRVVLADDSGLEVDALGGAPGVHSARYAGVDGPREKADEANNRKLLEALNGVRDDQRTARFVCVMALCDAERFLLISRGTFEGRIGHAPVGQNGFGYDPLFLLPEINITSAQLSTEDKNAISHRGHAARGMAQLLASVRWPET
ncbi:MAG: RdgB/HAM1 family non-canonical purine NTP pyrophosphatase [Phycisphaeraceae bacterium]|nr:RdgB/HAM1 family non-canonical purine NTP pyrophosphatase [Phycisphaeraceae bacterium]